ncbi:MAG TPA: FAD-dependent oxidoreductase [Chryseolinea sp.]
MEEPNLNTFAPKVPQKSDASRKQIGFEKGSHIVVVGAGAFGGWSALYLLRKGFKVTLIDAWGPAHSRSSSGDETRVIRSTYGANQVYFDMNVRALELWKENEKTFGRKIFFNAGVIWFCYENQTPLVDDSVPFAKSHSMDYEYLHPAEIRKRYPLINVADLHHAYLDPYGGYLKARESVHSVHEAFIKEGGKYFQCKVSVNAELDTKGILLSTGTNLQADAFVFACGSWLGSLFPDVLQEIITCTKQEVYYFGPPAEESQNFENLPVWVDVDGKDFYYGIPGNAYRGFKIGVDIRGETFDPTSGDHTLTPSALENARKFIAHRFPKLKGAPLVEHRICPYENSPDGNFVFDKHPGYNNVFLLGGGSGHGFKHGPALGELVADVFSGTKEIPEIFLLKRN